MGNRYTYALTAAALVIGVCGLPQPALAQQAQDATTQRRIGENESRVIETLVSIEETAPDEGARDGYLFKALSSQRPTDELPVGAAGTRAPMGASIDRIEFVVYPIDYRSSGIVTFIVTEDGRVFQKDLGPETATRAREIGSRAQAAGWKPVN